MKKHESQDSISWNLPVGFYCLLRSEKAVNWKWKSWFFWKLSPIKMCVCVPHAHLGCILWCNFPLEAIFIFWTPQILEGESKSHALLLVNKSCICLHTWLFQSDGFSWMGRSSPWCNAITFLEFLQYWICPLAIHYSGWLSNAIMLFFNAHSLASSTLGISTSYAILFG